MDEFWLGGFMFDRSKEAFRNTVQALLYIKRKLYANTFEQCVIQLNSIQVLFI